MNLQNLSPGEHAPAEVNVVIEISSRSAPIKYEIDKKSCMLMVDRFLGTSMFYPCEYGFVPQTLAEDDDPVDVLVVAPYMLMPGSVIKCRPIGMLRMADEAGCDTKILSVPISKLTSRYDHVLKPNDLGVELLNEIEHFFMHYKDLEKGKWAQIQGWRGPEDAKQEIVNSIERFRARSLAS